ASSRSARPSTPSATASSAACWSTRRCRRRRLCAYAWAESRAAAAGGSAPTLGPNHALPPQAALRLRCPSLPLHRPPPPGRRRGTRLRRLEEPLQGKESLPEPLVAEHRDQQRNAHANHRLRDDPPRVPAQQRAQPVLRVHPQHVLREDAVVHVQP